MYMMVVGVMHFGANDEGWPTAEFTFDLTDPSDGFLWVEFPTNYGPQRQRIAVVLQRCPYGGERAYFVCPKTGLRCELLYLADGEFASRQAHRLTYRSQSQTTLARLRRAETKAEARAFGLGSNVRPRGANRACLAERWEDLKASADTLFFEQTARRFGFRI